MSTARKSAENLPFVARVYEDDYREIQKLVQQYPNIETGGDLFGLWQDDNTVVVQLFIGPGKNCERTSTSFHQDINYLHKVGSVITTEEGLCNVGEWHSHHQIGMPEPSGADRRTVFNNMPQLGLERFVLFIATIGSTRHNGQPNKRSREVKLEQIKLRCFLFLGTTHEMVSGEIEQIKGSNPHRIHNRARRAIEDGAEIPRKDTPEKTSRGSDDYREQQQSGKKKPEKEKTWKTPQSATGKTLQQRTSEAQDIEQNGAGKPTRLPPPFSRETKPRVGAAPPIENYDSKENFTSRRKPQDDQEHGHRVEDQNVGRNREKGNQTGGGNNENRSPNTVSAPTRNRGSQGNVSPNGNVPTSFPTPQSLQFSPADTHLDPTQPLAQPRSGTQRNTQPSNDNQGNKLKDKPHELNVGGVCLKMHGEGYF